MRSGTNLQIVFVLIFALSFVGATPEDHGICAIEKAVIHYMRPGIVRNPPRITRIAIENEYALALWIDGYAGGVAVLQDKAGRWSVLENSGGWNSLDGLIRAGVPRKPATRLAKDFGM